MKRVETFQVSEVRMTSASPTQQLRGLLGFVSMTLNGALKVTGIALRRSAAGELVLSFPARRDATGRRRYLVRPIDDATRRHLEREVFAALGMSEGLPR